MTKRAAKTAIKPHSAPNPYGRLRAAPYWSAAYDGINTPLRLICGAGLITLLLLSIFHPLISLGVLAYVVSGVIIIMALLRICAVIYAMMKSGHSQHDKDEIDWPRYTVLAPIVHEHHMAARLMNALARLDYPRDKLEIIMICEEADPLTVAAVKANLRPPFRLIIARDSQPRTKPKALNIALAQSQSDYVTIYDAEDRPDPQQLKRAARAYGQFQIRRSASQPSLFQRAAKLADASICFGIRRIV